MEYRFLGRSGLQVSAIALGSWYVASYRSLERLLISNRVTYGGHVGDGMSHFCSYKSKIGLET